MGCVERRTHREREQSVQNYGGVNDTVYLWNFKQFNIARFYCFYMRREQNPILNNLKHHLYLNEVVKPINI